MPASILGRKMFFFNKCYRELKEERLLGGGGLAVLQCPRPRGNLIRAWSKGMMAMKEAQNRGGKRTLQYPWAMGLEAREGAIQSSNSFDCDSLAG